MLCIYKNKYAHRNEFVMNLQNDTRNLSMMMDFYKMTMANGYFKKVNTKDKVAFDVFYRKNPDAAGFAIFAGLQQIISYIQNLHFSKDDINYLRKQKLFSEEFLERDYKESSMDGQYAMSANSIH